jgi:HAMP domain-containing protein
MKFTTDSESARPKGSVVRRFNVMLVLLYLISLGATLPAVYYFTHQQVHDQASREMTLLVDVVKSVQDFVIKDLRPYFMAKEIFFPPALSGIAAAHNVARHFKDYQPAYYIKNASDNPRNPENKTQVFEQRLLDRFRGDRQLEYVVEEGNIGGNTYLVSAAPKVSVAGCLRCHGDASKAPKEVTDQYGKEAGFQYLPNDVVGVSVVGVPLANANAVALHRSVIAFGAITALFAVIFISLNVMVRTYLITPVLQIAKSAREVSQGELHKEMTVERDDELGELARSFELMRRSVVSAMRRLQGV